MQEQPVVKKRVQRRPRIAQALTEAVSRMRHGYVLPRPHKTRTKFSLSDIEIRTMTGTSNIFNRYSQLLGGSDAQCRVLMFDIARSGKTMAVMDVESLAFLLDATISTDPQHFFRRTSARKDSDD